MRQIGNGVVHGGTYTAHSVSLAAAEKTLEILADSPALADIAAYGEQLQTGISQILKGQGIAHCFVGHPSMGGMFLAQQAPTNYRQWVNSDYTFYDALAPQLDERGVLAEPDCREPWFICAAHDADCLRETLSAFEESITATIEKLSGIEQ